MREQILLTRRSLVSAAPAAAVVATGAMPALAAGTETNTMLRAPGSSKLQVLGKAWALNLEQQKAAEADCKRYASHTSAYKDADARWTALMDEEMELARAMWSEPASTPDDLAIKARVVLRTISLSGATFADPNELSPVDEWNLDETQGIAASLALDLLRLASAPARKEGSDA